MQNAYPQMGQDAILRRAEVKVLPKVKTKAKAEEVAEPPLAAPPAVPPTRARAGRRGSMFTTGEVKSKYKKTLLWLGVVFFYLNIVTNLGVIFICFRGAGYCDLRMTKRYPRGHHTCYASDAYKADRIAEIGWGIVMTLTTLLRCQFSGALQHDEYNSDPSFGFREAARAKRRVWLQTDVLHEARRSQKLGMSTEALAVGKILELFSEAMFSGSMQAWSLLRYANKWKGPDQVRVRASPLPRSPHSPPPQPSPPTAPP
jgi:hypothetical protein